MDSVTWCMSSARSEYKRCRVSCGGVEIFSVRAAELWLRFLLGSRAMEVVLCGLSVCCSVYKYLLACMCQLYYCLLLILAELLKCMTESGETLQNAIID